MSGTIDGFWIDDRIYRTFWHRAWLHFTVHCYTHMLEFTVTSSLAVAWWRFPTAHVPFPLGSRTISGLSYQLLTATAHNDWTPLTYSLTHQQTPLHSLTDPLTNCPVYNISTWTAPKQPLHYWCAFVAIEKCLFGSRYLAMVVALLLLARSLPSNGSTCNIMDSRHSGQVSNRTPEH
jgi:hypothetical protein